MAIAELTEDPAKALAKEKNAVVVFFASWCGDCRRSLRFESALSSELAGRVSFFRMDAVEFEKIADIYGVERYPTYVFFRRGAPESGPLVEPTSEKEVRDWINKKI
ncbi:MAG TPA: protein disulfide isomerase family protein [Candidatus Bilamarchaeum sp.]|nr:protein disulfide isomerase family protein [Candidatus Bilamarchaeum sp.]